MVRRIGRARGGDGPTFSRRWRYFRPRRFVARRARSRPTTFSSDMFLAVRHLRPWEPPVVARSWDDQQNNLLSYRRRMRTRWGACGADEAHRRAGGRRRYNAMRQLNAQLRRVELLAL